MHKVRKPRLTKLGQADEVRARYHMNFYNNFDMRDYENNLMEKYLMFIAYFSFDDHDMIMKDF